MKGGAKVVIEPHRHEGVFVAKAKEDALVTKNMVPGESVYGEKRISVEVCTLNIFVLMLAFLFGAVPWHWSFYVRFWWVSWFRPSVFLCGSCFILVYRVLH
jgi:hypothetical protein